VQPASDVYFSRVLSGSWPRSLVGTDPDRSRKLKVILVHHSRACMQEFQFLDSRSRTIRVAEAGDPLTKPKKGPKSCVAEKPVMYRRSKLV
jgi:hypothetical protein